MANKEQLNILNQGVKTWNTWREENPNAKVDLIRADFRGKNLSKANFSGTFFRSPLFKTNNTSLFETDFRGANLSDSILNGADLTHAKFEAANLRRAHLIEVDAYGAGFKGADLEKANFNKSLLRFADFAQANLSQTNFVEANLFRSNFYSTRLFQTLFHHASLQKVNFEQTILQQTDLSETDLRWARFNETIVLNAEFKNAILDNAKVLNVMFGNTNLSEINGLDKVSHSGPSTIGLDTIRKSKGKLPIEFMRGCGLSDIEIKTVQLLNPDLSASSYIDLTYQLTELNNSGAIQFHSCFISYSSKDEPLAKRLHTDLQESGVRCWFAPEDLKTGEKIRLEIDRAVSTHEKLLLLMSKDSIASDWVEHEVEKALAKERKEKTTMLFPIRIDDAVMETNEGWPDYVKNSRHIGDFREWHNEASYRRAFDRLKKDLQQNVEHDNGE